MTWTAAQHHPDKAALRSELPVGDPDFIHNINAAYNVLADDALRDMYDAELAVRGSVCTTLSFQERGKTRVSAALDLDCFEQIDDLNQRGDTVFQHPCRCGSRYILTLTQLVVEGVELVECQGCSEIIRVLWEDASGADGSGLLVSSP